MIYPNFIDYKPKTLVEYNSNFKSGFGLFFTLFEITKIIKSKILIKKQKKLTKNNMTKIKNLSRNNDEENIILREISIVEKNYPEYYNNNIILHFLKSKILHKLSDKFKNIDKNRSYFYEKDSICSPACFGLPASPCWESGYRQSLQ